MTHPFVAPTRGSRRVYKTWAALFAVVLGASACNKNTGVVNYSVSAQKNYESGDAALKADDWIAASKYFAFIKSRFPYSKYAVLAELRLADAEFGAEHYAEAVDSYRLFIKLHPTHENVVNGYANFRIGSAYFHMLPADFWLVPPSYEKDQGSTEDAGEEMKKFVAKFPDSPYRKDAQAILVEVGKRLAAHEWYVARFYWGREKPMGTVLRLRRLLDRYRGVGYDEEAMWLLGRAYQRVAMPDRARATWLELVQKFPASPRAAEARAALNGGVASASPPPAVGPTSAPKPASTPAPAPK